MIGILLDVFGLLVLLKAINDDEFGFAAMTAVAGAFLFEMEKPFLWRSSRRDKIVLELAV